MGPLQSAQVVVLFEVLLCRSWTHKKCGEKKTIHKLFRGILLAPKSGILNKLVIFQEKQLVMFLFFGRAVFQIPFLFKNLDPYESVQIYLGPVCRERQLTSVSWHTSKKANHGIAGGEKNCRALIFALFPRVFRDFRESTCWNLVGREARFRLASFRRTSSLIKPIASKRLWQIWSFCRQSWRRSWPWPWLVLFMITGSTIRWEIMKKLYPKGMDGTGIYITTFYLKF